MKIAESSPKRVGKTAGKGENAHKNLMKVAESPPKLAESTVRKRETAHFPVFSKESVKHTHKTQGLFGKGLQRVTKL